jgi:hypothetical protein
VAFATANPWLGDVAGGLSAVSFYLDLALDIREWPRDLSFEHKVCAGICQENIWDGTGKTEITSPSLGRRRTFQQAAFFAFSAAIIIAEEKSTFLAGRSSHRQNYTRVI